jgi:hypothetical protein
MFGWRMPAGVPRDHGDLVGASHSRRLHQLRLAVQALRSARSARCGARVCMKGVKRSGDTACVRACVRACMRACVHASLRACVYANKHTRTHARTYTPTPTHAHTQRDSSSQVSTRSACTRGRSSRRERLAPSPSVRRLGCWAATEQNAIERRCARAVQPQSHVAHRSVPCVSGTLAPPSQRRFS